jgi:hypothetical protein
MSNTIIIPPTSENTNELITALLYVYNEVLNDRMPLLKAQVLVNTANSVCRLQRNHIIHELTMSKNKIKLLEN